ncbi:MAG: serine/threonine protein kinase [Myxococcales bacterium FL481]|nr:MAG: serine/threonine protein kinase [Myxococcales bacterium FL481]
MARLGEYELLRPIGRGGSGRVWLGRRRGLGGATKTVAVKVLDPAAEGDDARGRFLREARLSMLLSHANVVQVFDAGSDDGVLFLVMEWVDGVDLGRLAKWCHANEARLPLDVVGYVIAELLRGLGYAHQLVVEGEPQGLVHRDVTPHNVLLSAAGEVKLADFGIARRSVDATTGMQVRGKLRYMAPEQALGRKASASADVYAVGAVLHELLDGRRFRAGRNDAQMREDVAAGVIPKLRVHVPHEVDELRRALLGLDPQSRPSALGAREQVLRWSDYADATAALARWVAQVASGTAAASRGLNSRPMRPRVGTERREGVLEQTQLLAATNEATRTTGTHPSVRPHVEPSGGRESLAMGDSRRRFGPPGGLSLAVSGLVAVCVVGGLAWREPVGSRLRVQPPSLAGIEIVPGERTGAAVASTPSSGRTRAGAGGRASVDLSVRRSSLDPFASPEQDRRATEATLPAAASSGRGMDPASQRAAANETDAPVAVRFTARDSRVLQVRVDQRQELALRVARQVELSPGLHLVEWRVRGRDSWRPAGRLRVRPGEPVTVTIRGDGRFDVSAAP